MASTELSNKVTTPWTDIIIINGRMFSKRALTLAWFQNSNDGFYKKYGFNFNPHDYPGLYEWGRKQLYGEN